MNKKIKSVLGFVFVVFMAFSIVGCGSVPDTGSHETGAIGEPAGATPSISITVQNDELSLYDSNAFVATLTNVAQDSEITYHHKAKGASEFIALGKSQSNIFVYTSEEAGEFEVKATVKVGNTSYNSNTVSYKVYDRNGDTFGAVSIIDKVSLNVDLTNDNGENPFIEHKSVNKYSRECAFIKGFEGNQFVFKSMIDIVQANGSDPHPKTGFIIKNHSNAYNILFDLKPNFSSNEVVFVQSYLPLTWYWNTSIVFNTDAKFRSDSGERIANELMLIRDVETLYFLVNGEFLGKVTIDGYDHDAIVGSYTMSQNSIFSEYSFFDGETEEFTTALNAVKSL